MTTITLSPYKKEPCYVCSKTINQLHVFRIIPKNISKSNFPQSIYDICKNTHVYTCHKCANNFNKFFTNDVATEIRKQFCIDNDELKKTQKCVSLAKGLLKPHSQKVHKIMTTTLSSTLNKPVDEIDLIELSNIVTKTWEEKLVEKINTIETAVQLNSVIIIFLAQNKHLINKYNLSENIPSPVPETRKEIHRKCTEKDKLKKSTYLDKSDTVSENKKKRFKRYFEYDINDILNGNIDK
jgi:hypothetical protein